MRKAGAGEFVVKIAHTADPEPTVSLAELEPTTWHEFQVSAINGTGVGPSSAPSEPVLTRAVEQARPIARKRRTQQGRTLLAAEREAVVACRATESELVEQIAGSERAIGRWEEIFAVRHGRAPSDDDRQASGVLRDEEHNQRVLRHELTEACVSTIDAELRLARKEEAVTKGSLRKWEKAYETLVGLPPTAEVREGDPRHKQIGEKLDEHAERIRRMHRRRRWVSRPPPRAAVPPIARPRARPTPLPRAVPTGAGARCTA